MIKILILTVFSLFISTLTWAKEPFFIGTWDYQTCDSEKIMCAVIDMTFTKDKVFVDAYPPLRHQCEYKIKMVNDTSATLTLFNHKGDKGEWKKEIIIEKIPSSPNLMIDGQSPYIQTHPVKDDHREPGEK